MRRAAGNGFQLRVVATVRARRTGSRCTPHPGRKVSMLNYPQAIVIGLLQGVTELFPISSLGIACWFRPGSAVAGSDWSPTSLRQSRRTWPSSLACTWLPAVAILKPSAWVADPARQRRRRGRGDVEQLGDFCDGLFTAGLDVSHRGARVGGRALVGPKVGGCGVTTNPPLLFPCLLYTSPSPRDR